MLSHYGNFLLHFHTSQNKFHTANINSLCHFDTYVSSITPVKKYLPDLLSEHSDDLNHSIDVGSDLLPDKLHYSISPDDKLKTATPKPRLFWYILTIVPASSAWVTSATQFSFIPFNLSLRASTINEQLKSMFRITMSRKCIQLYP